MLTQGTGCKWDHSIGVDVQKEGSLVSSAAMRRWHTPPPPVPAVPPSQTNDCKGFLRFKPSQSRPKSSSSRPKGCGGVLLRVLSVRSAVEGGQFVRTVAAVRAFIERSDG